MRHDDAYLLDMLLAAREARGFAAGLTFDEFERYRMAQLAILKSIEVVGEAASRVSTGCMESHPEIPWSGIVGMRNRLVHAQSEQPSPSRPAYRLDDDRENDDG